MKQKLNETFAGRGLNSPKSIEEAMTYLVRNQDTVFSVFKGTSKILLINDKQSPLPKFRCPMWIDKDASINPHKDTNYMISDTRDLRGGDVDLMKAFCVLAAGWEDETVDELYVGFTILPHKAFTQWIARNLSVRYSLDIYEQNRVAVYAALYYLLLGRSLSELFNSRNEGATVQRISQASNCPATLITEILQETKTDLFEQYSGFYLLIELCKTVSTKLEKTLSRETLFAATTRVWLGDLGPTLCTLALEYPPAFIALIRSAIKDNSYNNTTLHKLLKEYLLMGSGRDMGTTFLTSVNQAIAQYQR